MNKQITVFGLCYNEEFMLPFFIAHYRKMFPGCRIVLWDNESTDRTHGIAIVNDCEIKTYCTGGKLNDVKYLELKNEWWRDADTEWVCIVDIDEHLEIDHLQLSNEERSGYTLINFDGYNMVNLKDNLSFNEITYGVRAPSYDKYYLFNKSKINEINYNPGAHTASPIGDIRTTYNVYRCLHYKYLNPNYMVNRHAHFASRLSDVNLKHHYGGHYQYSEKRIRKEFEEARKNAIKIL